MALRKWRRDKAAKEPAAEPESSDEYRCISIRCGHTACDAARRIEGERLLLKFVHLFTLPLPECDAARCRCVYEHFTDRRGEERRMPFGSVYVERRSGDDRRKEDDSPPTPNRGTRSR